MIYLIRYVVIGTASLRRGTIANASHHLEDCNALLHIVKRRYIKYRAFVFFVKLLQLEAWNMLSGQMRKLPVALWGGPVPHTLIPSAVQYYTVACSIFISSAPCRLWGCKNRPAPFPGWMS